MTVARHRTKPKRVKLTFEVAAAIRARLAQRWSPEQIAGRQLLETGQRLSAETITSIFKRSGGTYRHLRYQGKPYRKKYGRTDYRGRIPGRVDIDQRPYVN